MSYPLLYVIPFIGPILVMSCLVQTLYVRHYTSIYFHYGLQRVIGEMVTYVKEAQQYEREIFCKYIAKCSILYGSCMLFAYVTVTTFLLGPVILSTSFPLDAEYPFNVNYTPVNAIIYLHQSFVCCQCAANICLCICGALLLWFTAARFECLAVEFKKSSNIDMVITCVKKQLLLRR